MASFGITMLVAISEIGMVIVIMIVKTIMAAVTTDSKESFNKAMDEIFSRSDFFAKTTLLITTIALIIVFICYYFILSSQLVCGEHNINSLISLEISVSKHKISI